MSSVSPHFLSSGSGVQIVPFAEISRAKYYHKQFTTRAVIAGKSVDPYAIPRVVVVKCAVGNSCSSCKYQSPTILTIEAKGDGVLKFIDKSDNQRKGVIKQIFKIGCKEIQFTVKEVQNIERIFMHEVISYSEKNRDRSVKTGFYLGYGLEVNQPYVFTGYQTTDPNTQAVTYVFSKAERTKGDIDSFNIKEHVNELQVFQTGAKDEYEMMVHLERLYGVYARNVTNIHYRPDLHMAIDTVFRSVIDFYFAGEYVKKGWLDVVLVGDPRSGKGYIAEKLINFFGVGEVVNSENASYAGLVAGLQQFGGKHWVVTWGKIPMNDRGLLMIDEAGNLGDGWNKLSRIRSEGIAEIYKIHSQATSARTRLIWVTNPVNRTINSFSYGIQALQEVVKAPEDIARFDYAVVTAHEEVDMKKINKRKPQVPWIFTQQEERDLILWSWSRSAKQVYFTPEAEKTIFELAVHMSELFDFSIPLVQGENVRLKLAKIAVSLAARFFSTNKEGTHIVVERKHARCAWIMLWIIYRKSSHGYLSYSKLRKRQEIGDPQFEEVTNYLRSWNAQEEYIYNWLLAVNTLEFRELKDALGVSEGTVSELFALLVRTNCLQKRGSIYIKNPAFNRFLRRKVLGDKELEQEMYEDTYENNSGN